MADREGRIIISGEGSQLVPAIGAKLSDIVQKALWNIDNFNYLQFEEWLDRLSLESQKLARTYPPDRVYQLKGVRNPQHPQIPVLGVVVGYPHPGVAVHVLGLKFDQADLIVDPLTLRDVTDDLRAQRLELNE